MAKAHRKGKRRSGGTGERTCVVSREIAPSSRLVRWFRGPDGDHWPDWTGRAPGSDGRAVYTLPSTSIIRRAVSMRKLSGDADELVARFVSLGERELRQRLGLANRAGALAVGQRGAEAAFASDTARVLLVADDAGASGQRKFGQQAGRKEIPCIVFSAGAALAKPLGREFVSVATISEESFSERVLFYAGALAGEGEMVVSVDLPKIQLERAEEPR